MRYSNGESTRTLGNPLGLCAALGLLLTTGCSTGDGSGGTTGDNAGTGSLYAVVGAISNVDATTTYVSLVSSLDVKEIDDSKAYEFPGTATVATTGGWLFVADGESPIVTRYSIGKDGTLQDDGKISFANYGLDTVSLDDWGNAFVSPTKAYLNNSTSGSQILWNPTSLEITGEVKSPDLVHMGVSLDGSGAMIRGNRLYRTVFWKDWDAYSSSKEQYIATYDVEGDKRVSLTAEQRCPALNSRTEKDEDGNLYFSNWIYNVIETLQQGAPKSCALRMNAGSDALDPSWVLNYADLTEGREAAEFSYLADGKGLLLVFHDERVKIEPTSDPFDLALSTNWRLWSVDLKHKTAIPVEGIDWLAGGYSPVKLDGRSFVLAPLDSEYSKTNLYEITSYGHAELRFGVRGFSTQIVKVR
jgi:hypothetical protein